MSLVGGDFSLFPSPYGNVAISQADALAISHVLTEANRFEKTFAVPSAGIHPGMVPQLLADFGDNLVINAGGGIFGHPDGPIQGVQAFRAAIDASVRQVSLAEAAQEFQRLRRAIEQCNWTSRLALVFETLRNYCIRDTRSSKPSWYCYRCLRNQAFP